MGAQQSKFKYKPGELLQQQDVDKGRLWAVRKGWLLDTLGRQRVAVTIFAHTRPAKASLALDEAIANAVQRLKVLRHTAIIKYLNAYAPPGQSYLVTEPLLLLNDVLPRLTAWQCLVGLHNILQAVSFLHLTCGLSHNNISPEAVYFDPARRTWKLGGLEFCKPIEETTEKYLKATQPYRLDAGLQDLEPSQTVHQRDCAALCLLIDYVQANCKAGPEQTDALNGIGAALARAGKDPMGSLQTVLDGPLFAGNEVISLVNYMDELETKSEADKQLFFSGLLGRVRQIPASAAAQIVLPSLLTPRALDEPLFAYGESLPAVLAVKMDQSESDADTAGVVPSELYQACVVPLLVSLYHHRSHTARLALLAHIDSYVAAVESSVWQDVLVPELVVGLEEVNAELLLATMSGVLVVLQTHGDLPVLEAGKKSDAKETLSSLLIGRLEHLVYNSNSAVRVKALRPIFELMVYGAGKDSQPAHPHCLKSAINFLVQLVRSGDGTVRLAAVKGVLEHYRSVHVQVVLGRLLPVVAPLAADADRDVRAMARDVTGCMLEHSYVAAEEGRETYVPLLASRPTSLSMPSRAIFSCRQPRRVPIGSSISEDTLYADTISVNSAHSSSRPSPGVSTLEVTASTGSLWSSSLSQPDSAANEWGEMDHPDNNEPIVIVCEKAVEEQRLQRLVERERRRQQRLARQELRQQRNVSKNGTVALETDKQQNQPIKSDVDLPEKESDARPQSSLLAFQDENDTEMLSNFGWEVDDDFDVDTLLDVGTTVPTPSHDIQQMASKSGMADKAKLERIKHGGGAEGGEETGPSLATTGTQIEMKVK